METIVINREVPEQIEGDKDVETLSDVELLLVGGGSGDVVWR